MLDQPNPNTIAALERIMIEMQNLVDHPRIQQKTWVAKGKEWLPLLQIVHGELTGRTPPTAPNASVSSTENVTLLVAVTASGGQSYINITLANVQQVEVYRGDEAGYAHVRGAHSGFILKDGRKYLTSADEAQRIVDAMRKHDG